MSYLGDFLAGDVVDLKFCTVGSNGAPTALDAGAISVYKDNDVAQSTAGVTLTADFDSVTGLNHVRITTATDATFYANGSDFQVVITTGTVGGTSVVGYVVAEFSLANRLGVIDTLLKRDVDTVEASAAVHSLASVILKLVSKFDAQTGITYRTNGTDTHMTQTPVTDSGMTPIRSLGVAS